MSLLKTVQPYLNNYICILKLENMSLKYDLANAVDKTTLKIIYVFKNWKMCL